MRKHTKRKSLPALIRKPLALFGSMDALARISALIHLLKKSKLPMRSKLIWGAALAFINSLGIVPLAYYLIVAKRK